VGTTVSAMRCYTLTLSFLSRRTALVRIKRGGAAYCWIWSRQNKQRLAPMNQGWGQTQDSDRTSSAGGGLSILASMSSRADMAPYRLKSGSWIISFGPSIEAASRQSSSTSSPSKSDGDGLGEPDFSPSVGGSGGGLLQAVAMLIANLSWLSWHSPGLGRQYFLFQGGGCPRSLIGHFTQYHFRRFFTAGHPHALRL